MKKQTLDNVYSNQQRRSGTWLSLLAAIWFCCLWPASEAAAQAAGSNGSNYKTGVSVSVDGRTGAASIATELFKLPGIIPGIDASYSLHYDSTRATTDAENGSSAFGLPPGWDLNYSYFGFGSNTSYAELNIDGGQSYPLVDSYTTEFTLEDGSSKLINTQMMQYNRADANVIDYIATGTTPPVTSVCGIDVRLGMRNLNGMIQLFSVQGLMLTEIDRFGNHIDFCYLQNSPVAGAKLKSLTDSWNNEVAFCYCDGTDNQVSACSSVVTTACGTTPSGRVIAVLPDGRQVGYTVADALVTEVVDAQGKTTRLDWEFDPAGCQSGSSAPWSLTAMTSPLGNFTELVYNCLQVCTEEVSGENGCSASESSTLWPVVKTLYACPNAQSSCATQPGRLTTQYDYGIAQGEPNYSGFPEYSPFIADPNFPGADRLMQSGDINFTYQTSVSQLDAAGQTVHQTLNTYNYVHLLTRSDTTASGDLAKVVQHCYTDLVNGVCPIFNEPFTAFPANYQSPKVTGSCVFNVAGIGTQGSARQSLSVREYNSFGYIVHEQKFHGSANTGILSNCAENGAVFNASNLTLVSENFHGYDLPQDTDSGDRLLLGQPSQGTGHFGLKTSTASFAYADILDLQDSNQYCGADGTPPSPGSPLRVNLSCLTLTDASDNVPANTLVKTHIAGALNLSTVAAKQVLEQCANPAWDDTAAPPKVTTVGHDQYGRVTSRQIAWGIGPTQPGISSTSDSISYQRVAAPSAAAFCTGSDAALQTTHTDAQGNQSTILACVQNGFLLTSTDADGDTTTYTKDVVGMTTQLTHANGTSSTYQHYYACPTTLKGDATCPTSASALKACPQSPQNSCVVRTLLAGTGNSSYADQVTHVAVRDGLGRSLQSWDNLGGTTFSDMQLRSQHSYDSRGLIIAHSSSIGTGTEIPALIYTTTIDYGPKLRPQTQCGALGSAQQYIHDDVTQASKTLFNGQQTGLSEYNDSQKLTVAIDCELINDPVGSAVNTCPSTAADLTQASCTGGNNYLTTILRDGTGVSHTTSAAALNADELGASTQCIAGTLTYSADLEKYAYTYNSTASTSSEDNTFVAGITQWERDLHGLTTDQQLTLTTGGTTGSTDSFSSDSYVFDNLGRQTHEINKLSSNSVTLQNVSTYNNIGQVSSFTDYAGTTFYNYYDNMKRLVRFCHSSSDQNTCAGLNSATGPGGGISCTAGETYVRDAITGQTTELTHFINPDSSCTETGDGKDIAGDSIQYTYTPFGSIASKRYRQNVIGSSNGDGNQLSVTLHWGYDPYQRAVCFRDAMASTEQGEASSVCGDENTAVALDFAPTPTTSADNYLSWNVYYPDSDPYRRGMLQSACRIVNSSATSSGFETRCTDLDYYTPESTDGGSCSASAPTLSAPGAYAGQLKSRTNCKGGSCATGNGTLLYMTRHDYDSHRRPCRVTSSDGDGVTIFGSTYQYDQYNNLLSETAYSGLDTSTDSNYQLSYSYDGMQRLLNSTRSDTSGTLLQTIAYEFDAASNVKTKLETTYQQSTNGTDGSTGKKGNGLENAPAHAQVNCRDFGLAGGHGKDKIKNKDKTNNKDKIKNKGCDATDPNNSVATVQTSYTYNADGALTEVLVTTDSASIPEMTALVWDNYDGTSSPATVRAANGNLQQVTAADGSIKSYTFDARDRLAGVQAASQTVAYSYDPASMMTTSTLDGGAGYRFYYDMSRNARAVNVIQAQSTWGNADLASARMGRDRYLSDGSNQLTLRHRKDSDALYDPDTSSFTKYNYDPYGAPLAGTEAQGTVNYDLHQNQFRYSNEYTDALTGAQYLRARWYDPALQVFLSRDPAANLSRYGYGGGNPVNRMDPSGRTFVSFFRHLSPFEQGLLGGASLGTINIAFNAETERGQFFKGKNLLMNLQSLVLTAGAVYSFGGSAIAGAALAEGMIGKTLVGGVLAGGGLLGGVESAVKFVKDPHARIRELDGLAGGLVGGLAINTVSGVVGVASVKVVEGKTALFLSSKEQVEYENAFEKSVILKRVDSLAKDITAIKGGLIKGVSDEFSSLFTRLHVLDPENDPLGFVGFMTDFNELDANISELKDRYQQLRDGPYGVATMADKLKSLNESDLDSIGEDADNPLIKSGAKEIKNKIKLFNRQRRDLDIGLNLSLKNSRNK